MAWQRQPGRFRSLVRLADGLLFGAGAATESSLRFLLVGALALIPIILAYTAYAYWVFRGHVDLSKGYH
ncbi:Cytochrome oxidase subunit II (plasmid) [Martelella mediterranea DSM 17316]|uniref:Cytochrome oxidase subunit II n=1 Tax=Martelella mediterranea DSM 17316 TaxID=1122214 RepID=A0A1U9Z7T5_9HYPH|nr:Cytochrome oxidase subunit II [Martelella mediterranea DSM 17316]